jgi:hypothetical protein
LLALLLERPHDAVTVRDVLLMQVLEDNKQ